jgi:hypothetical protein
MNNYSYPSSFPSLPSLDEKSQYAAAVVQKHGFSLYLMDDYGRNALNSDKPLRTEDEFREAFRVSPKATLGLKTGPSSGVTVLNTWPSVLNDLHSDGLFCFRCDVSICFATDAGDGFIEGPTKLLFRSGNREFSYGHSVKYKALSVLSSGTVVSIPPVVHEACHPDCTPYFEFFSGQSLLNAEISPLPDEIYLTLRSHREVPKTAQRSPIGPRLLHDIPEGGRHNELLSRIGYMANREQIIDDRLYEYAHTLNNRVCKPPLPKKEVDEMVKFVFRKNGGIR